MKLARKERIGSRLRRHYEAPQTPFQRVADSPGVDSERVVELRRLRATLDPLQLSQTIQAKREGIFQLSREAVPRKQASSTVPPPEETRKETKPITAARAQRAERKTKTKTTAKTRRKEKPRRRRVTFYVAGRITRK